MSTQNAFTEYFRNQALAGIGRSHSIEQALQTGNGFYKGLSCQKGYGIGGLFGSLARRFVPLLKLLAQAAGRCVLRVGKTFAEDLIDRKSVGEAATSSVRELNRGHKKRRRGDQPVIPKKRRCWYQDYYQTMTEGLKMHLIYFPHH